ncbi:prolyl oligopeptidase family serine peptidase [Kitasatospora sp. GP82]|uniref:S9 family peptidase n=1 Tax=Kitasatospora sp. GP82 TaxID=3035089 RepID=UPI0024754239|nr:prolyl oligopeptidase family serine peptidase [Kitasatospora sp. GP82]MDH6128773.1 dipeptidyl aminopeptidase/acylaminoacyl peptidase [Kitasatospora sp. GP82]
MAAETRNRLTGTPGLRTAAPTLAFGPGNSATAPAAPVAVPLPDLPGSRDTPAPVTAHGCWYPSADPTGGQVAFICNRAGVPQLWAGPVDGSEAHLLDASPDPVTEVSWSPDGHWIAYTVAPGGGEHTRVLCIRPDGTGRRLLGGAEPGTSAYLGRWTRDGSALAVTIAEPAVARPVDGGAEQTHDEPGSALPDTSTGPYTATPSAGRSSRDGPAVLLGGAHPGEVGVAAAPSMPPQSEFPAHLEPGPSAAESAHEAEHLGAGDDLAVYLVDPGGVRSPVLLATDADAATLRLCDTTPDGRLALLRRGPRGRREAVVLRTAGLERACVVPVADGDPWIGRFSPDGRTLWLRSDAGREFAVLLTAELGPDGDCLRLAVAAERDDADLELLAVSDDGGSAVLAWNVQGRSEVEAHALPGGGVVDVAPPRPVALPHEVVTRITPAGPGGLLLALSGSVRRPGVWWLPSGASPVRTGWSSRDADAVPAGRPPVRPEPLRLSARDGLSLGGWYYRAPRQHGRPSPCVVHLHGGPEEQERPVFDPLYHELLGRGLDVFAPDVRGSSGWGRSFRDADLGTGRFAAIDDVADCAAHAVTAGLADPGRLAVMGRSYGGYLVLASLVWHPELFRTGVAVCGMSDFETFFAGTEPWIAASAAAKYGHPEHDRELLHALSPMTRIDALRAPLLAVHGEHDTNVPPGESEQVVQAARRRGVPAELLMLRDEGHEFLHTGNRVLFRRTAASWIERHLEP